MRILLTGVGCPGIVGTLKALRNNPSNEQVFIFGVDMNSESVGRLLCDEFQRISCPEQADYIHILQRICEVNKIDIVIPQTTRETVVLSNYKNVFDKIGVKVMVNDSKLIDIYNNKYLLLNLCEKNNLPGAYYCVADNERELITQAYKMNYPFMPIVIKPLMSNGGRGVRILQKSETFDEYMNKKSDGMRSTLNDIIKIYETAEVWPKVLLTSYLPGLEYTVDVLNIPNHRIIITRLRNKIRSGISFVTEIVKNEKIEKQINILLDDLPLIGVFGFQFKNSGEGVPCILECNPRIQGTMVTSQMAGINIIWAAVEYYAYGKLKTPLPEKINDVKLYRYWGGVSKTEEGLVFI